MMPSEVQRVQHQLIPHGGIDLQRRQIFGIRLDQLVDDVTKGAVMAPVLVQAGSMQESLAAVRAPLHLAALVPDVPHEAVLSRVARPANAARETTRFPRSVQLGLGVPVATVGLMGLQKARPGKALAAVAAIVATSRVLVLGRSLPWNAMQLALCNIIKASIRGANSPVNPTLSSSSDTLFSLSKRSSPLFHGVLR